MSNGLKGFAGASIYSDDVFPAIIEIEATKEHRRIASKAELPDVPFFFISCNVGEEVSVQPPVVLTIGDTVTTSGVDGAPIGGAIADVIILDDPINVVTDPAPEVSALSMNETTEVTK